MPESVPTWAEFESLQQRVSALEATAGPGVEDLLPPANVSASFDWQAGEIRIEWSSQPAAVAGYGIYYKDPSMVEQSWFTIHRYEPASATSSTMGGYLRQGTYQFQVTSLGPDGAESAPSTVATAQV